MDDYQEQVFFNVPLSKLEPIFKRWMKEVHKDLNNETKPENKKYSINVTAARNSLSPGTIRNYIKEGKIKAQKIGRRILIDESQFEEGLSEVKSLKYKR